MLILWITINLANLWYPLIIYLIRIELDLRSNVVSIFAYKITTINPMVMAKFFHIIYKTILLSLFISEYCDRGLLRTISTYFGIVEINSYNMFHLHYLL